MKFKVINFGCKVNTYESTYFEEKLIEEGFTEAIDSKPDFIIINTCSVTNTADTKCKKFIRRVKRENPNAVLVATGCSVQNNFEEYKDMGINILVNNFKKSIIPDLCKEYLKNKENIYIKDDNRNQNFDAMNLSTFTKHTRAFMKIQDGCDNFCSYCVIPLLRGKPRSKSFDEIVNEAKELASNGHNEIVLVGIHTGSYNDNGKDLVDLINELSKIDHIKRIRISSIEITELNDKFMEMLKNNKKVVDHMHIPLQSGSEEILKAMNRKYDKKYFKDKIQLIRSIRPDINITTDVIVGFPGETEENFDECFEFCKEIGFGKIHVFPYSKRNHTKAAQMPNHVNDEEKKNRDLKLIRLSDILSCTYEKKFIGKKMQIIAELNHKNEIVGFTSNYIKVLVENPEGIKPGDIIDVELISYEGDYIKGKFIERS